MGGIPALTTCGPQAGSLPLNSTGSKPDSVLLGMVHIVVGSLGFLL